MRYNIGEDHLKIHFKKLTILVRGTPLVDISNPQEIGDFNMGEIGQIQPGRAVSTHLVLFTPHSDPHIPIVSRDVYCLENDLEYPQCISSR